MTVQELALPSEGDQQEPKPTYRFTVPQIMVVRYLQEFPIATDQKTDGRYDRYPLDPHRQAEMLQIQDIHSQGLLGDFETAEQKARELNWLVRGHAGYLAAAKAATVRFPNEPTRVKNLLGRAKRRVKRIWGSDEQMHALVEIADFEIEHGLPVTNTLDIMGRYEKQGWWFQRSFDDREHTMMTARLKLYRLIHDPPKTKADREALRADIKERLWVFRTKEPCYVENILQGADRIIARLAHEYGLEAIEQEVAKIPLRMSFLVGYLGLARFAADTNHPDLPRLLERAEKNLEGWVSYDDNKSLAIVSAVENLTRSLVYHPGALEHIDIGQDFIAGEKDWPLYNLKAAVDTLVRCAYLRRAARDYREYAAKLEDHAAQLEHEGIAQQLIALADSKRDRALELLSNDEDEQYRGFTSDVAYASHATHLLGLEGIPIWSRYQDIYRHIINNTSDHWSNTPDGKDDSFFRLAWNLQDSGYHAAAFEIALHIQDEYRRHVLLGDLLINDLNLRPEPPNLKDVSLASLVEVSKSPQPLRFEGEAIGKFSTIATADVLAHPDIADDVKVSFMIGRAQCIEVRNGKEVKLVGKSLKEAIAYMQSRKISGEATSAFIDGLLSTQNYDIAVTHLFALMGHTKANDYSTMTEFSPFAIPAVLGLLRLKNQKGIAIASQLFASEHFHAETPADKEMLFDALKLIGYFPETLITSFDKKIKEGYTKQTLLEFSQYMLATHNALPSTEILEMLMPQGRQVLTLTEMKSSLDFLYSNTDQYETVAYPPELLSNIVATRGTGAYYLRHAGDRSYSHVASYPYKTFEQLAQKAASMKVDQERYQEFANHLTSAGYSSTEVGTIIKQLETGLYPFGEDWPVSSTRHVPALEFTAQNNIDFEIQTVDEQIDLMRYQTLFAIVVCESHGVVPSSYEDALVQAQQFDDFFEESSIRKWRSNYMKYLDLSYAQFGKYASAQVANINAVASSLADYHIDGNDPLVKDFMPHFSLLFDQRTQIESRRSVEAQVKRNYRATVVEKGSEPFRFARVVDAVAECVNSNYQDDHVAYMARRLADPLSLAIELADAETGKVMGNVEMRTGRNEKTGQFELFVVGIYSAGKNKSFCNQVMQFVEQAIARPLRMRAINIAAFTGGAGELLGYNKVTAVPSLGCSPVVYINGTKVLARGDDIYYGPPGNTWHNQFDLNDPFPFTGYRKELQYGFS